MMTEQQAVERALEIAAEERIDTREPGFETWAVWLLKTRTCWPRVGWEEELRAAMRAAP